MTLIQSKPPRGGRWHFNHPDGTEFSHPALAELKKLVWAHDKKTRRAQTSEAVIEEQLAKTHPASVLPVPNPARARRTNDAPPPVPVEPEQQFIIKIKSLPSPIASRIRLSQVTNLISAHRFTVIESRQLSSDQPA